MVKFENGDLLRMPVPTERYDVVFCRNTVIYFTEGRRTAEPDLPLSVTVGSDGKERGPDPFEAAVIGHTVRGLSLAVASRLLTGPFHWPPVRVRFEPRDTKHWIEVRPGPPMLRVV